MTVVEDDARRLILRDRPWLIGLVLAALILVLAGLATGDALAGRWHDAGLAVLGLAFLAAGFAAFVRQEVLILDRPSGLLVLRTSTVRGASERTRPLADLADAVVETGSSTRTRTTRLVLVMADGSRIPVTPVYSSGTGADRGRDAVLAWLARAPSPQNPKSA